MDFILGFGLFMLQIVGGTLFVGGFGALVLKLAADEGKRC